MKPKKESMKELSVVKYVTGGKIVVVHFDMEREQTDSDIKELYKRKGKNG